MNTKKRSYRYNINKMSVSKTTANQAVDIKGMFKKMRETKSGEELEQTINKLEINLKDKPISTQLIMSLSQSACSIIKESLNHLPEVRNVTSIKKRKVINAIDEIEWNLSLGLFLYPMIDLFMQLMLNFQELCMDLCVRISNKDGEILHVLMVYSMVVNEYDERL